METPLFIDYANLSLLDRPGQLKTLSANIHLKDRPLDAFFAIIRLMEEFNSVESESDAEELLQCNPGRYEHLAYEAVFGYLDNSCEDCFGVNELSDWFTCRERHIRCFECQHESFKETLGWLIESGFDIDYLRNFVFEAKEIVQMHIDISADAVMKKYNTSYIKSVFGLEDRITINNVFLTQAWGHGGRPYFDRFNFFVRGLIGFDLLYFMKDHNRNRKLIRNCRYNNCGKYFIARGKSHFYCKASHRINDHAKKGV